MLASPFLCFHMEVSLGGELFSPLTAWRMGHHKARLLRAVDFKLCVDQAGSHMKRYMCVCALVCVGINAHVCVCGGGYGGQKGCSDVPQALSTYFV